MLVTYNSLPWDFHENKHNSFIKAEQNFFQKKKRKKKKDVK